MIFNIILFSDFETLDVFGPVEIFGKTENAVIRYLSVEGGVIENVDNVRITTQPIKTFTCERNNILFIPGGMGARTEIHNKVLTDSIKSLAENSQYILTVCTGSALLAKTGLLDGKNATSNKRSFDWVKKSSIGVNWVKQARWVRDGKYYTSSGVSAGIDMALGFVRDISGLNEARRIAFRIEYNWQENENIDGFCQ